MAALLPAEARRPHVRSNGYGAFYAHGRDPRGYASSIARYEAMDKIAQYAAFSGVDPGPTNVAPSWEATGEIIAFIRNPEKFPMNRYVEWRPTDAMIGLYKVLDSAQGQRIVTDAEFDFPDGATRPEMQDNLIQFYDVPFTTNRKWYGYTLGDLTSKNQNWNVHSAMAAVTMQQAMTNRTNRFVGMMETVSNWGANAADANTLNAGAGFWDQANTINYAIRKTVNAVLLAIKRATGGMVSARDLRMVIGESAAPAIGQSKELADYVKNSYWSKFGIEGDIYGGDSSRSALARYNIPPELYGVETVLEDATIVTTPKGVTATPSFCKDGNSVCICAKIKGLPGDQVGTFAVPNFSTFQWYGYGGPLQVKTFNEPINERTLGGCEENFCEAMPAPASGFLITNILSTGSTH